MADSGGTRVESVTATPEARIDERVRLEVVVKVKAGQHLFTVYVEYSTRTEQAFHKTMGSAVEAAICEASAAAYEWTKALCGWPDTLHIEITDG